MTTRPPEHPVEDLEAVWRALADPHRRRLLDLLRSGPRTTGSLAAEFDISRYGVMKHLGVLTDAGLVLIRREGRERWNYLNAVPLRQIYERWVTRFEDQWAASLLNLKRHIELKEAGVGISGQTDRIELGNAKVELELAVPVSPNKAYEAFVKDIGKWWSRDYVMGGDKTTGLVLEDVPGGRLLEQWGDSDGAMWAQVIQVRRGQMIHLGIPEGVMWSGPGYIGVQFEATDNGTTVKLAHQSTQLHADDGHAGYLEGWTTLVMERFARYAAGEDVENAVG